MILTASAASSSPAQPTPAARDTPTAAHTRSQSRTKSTNKPQAQQGQHSPRSSSTSSSQPSTQPSELFEHDMTSPSSELPSEVSYDEDVGGQQTARLGKGKQKLNVDLGVLEGEGEEMDDDTSRITVTSLSARPMPGAPVSPIRLAKLANAFGVSTPLPHAPDTHSPHQFGFAPPSAQPHSHARSSATRFLVHVIPPASLALDAASEQQMKRGALVPLHSTLKGQLGAVAREYRLPSTTGMVLYLIQEDPELPTGSGAAGPKISDDAWKLLWQPILRMEREELITALTSPRSASVLSHSPVPSPPTTLNDSPVDDSSITSPSISEPRVLKPLNTSSAASITPSPQRRAFPFSSSISGKPSPLDQHPSQLPPQQQLSSRMRQDSIASLRSVSSSHASRPSTALSLVQPPIVGKVEFDIERHKAPWFDIWLARTRGGGRSSAAPSPSPSLLNGPLPLQLPSRAGSRAGSFSHSRIGSRAASRTGSVSRSPRSPMFRFDSERDRRGERGEDGLLSPGNAQFREREGEREGGLLGTPGGESVRLGSVGSETPEEREVEGEEYVPLEEGEEDAELTPEELVVSPRSDYDGQEAEEEEKEEGGQRIPELAVNSDPLGDVFPSDNETWRGLRNSLASNVAQPAGSLRSSVASGQSGQGVQGLGIRMNGMPYSPHVQGPELAPGKEEEQEEHEDDEDLEMELELEPPSPARFDEDGAGSGSGTDWDSTDDVEDVVGLWNAKHTPEGGARMTTAQLREELRDSLRHPVTVVEVRRASKSLSEDKALSPEPVHSPDTVTPGGSPTESAAHSRIPSNATATPLVDGSPSLSPPGSQGTSTAGSPTPPPPKRAIPPAPLRLAPSPLISDRVIDREGDEDRERDSALSLAYLSTTLQKTQSRASSNRQSADSEADSLRATQIRMQRELDDIEKAYAQISPRPEMSSTSFMDLNNSPDLNSAVTPVFPGQAGKPPGLLVSGWPAVPLSPTVAQQGLNPLMASGIIGQEERPFAPATISIETLQRARAAEEEGMNVTPQDKRNRRSTKPPSITVGHERNDSVRSRDSSRFSDDSAIKADTRSERKRSQVMSVRSIRRLWKKGASGSLQGVPEAESPPLPPRSPRSPIPPPSPRKAGELASPRVSTSSSVDSVSDSKDSKRDSGLDHFRFDQDARLSIRSPTPNLQAPGGRLPPVPPIPTDKTASLRNTRTRSVLNKWASPKLRSQPAKGENDDDGGVRINGRSVQISAPMHVIHGQADIRDARFAAAHRAAPSPPQVPPLSPGATPPTPPSKDASPGQRSTTPSRSGRESATPGRPPRASPSASAKGPARQNSIRRKPVPGLEEVDEDGVLITHSPASSISRSHRAGPSISASLLSQPVQEEAQPRPSMSSSTDDPLSPSELQTFEMVTPVGYAHIRSSPAF